MYIKADLQRILEVTLQTEEREKHSQDTTQNKEMKLQFLQRGRGIKQ